MCSGFITSYDTLLGRIISTKSGVISGAANMNFAYKH